MNHQEYEDWLYSDEMLRAEQERALDEHLQTCESCRVTQAAWGAVEYELVNSPMVAPAQDFSLRWMKYLEADRRRLQRRQSLAMLAFSVGGAILLFASLILVAWPWVESPGFMLLTGLYRLYQLYQYAGATQEIILDLTRVMAGVIPLSWWLAIIGVASEILILWIISLRLLAKPRRVTK